MATSLLRCEDCFGLFVDRAVCPRCRRCPGCCVDGCPGCHRQHTSWCLLCRLCWGCCPCPRCPACGDPVPEEGGLCADCAASLTLCGGCGEAVPDAAYCGRCGGPLTQPPGITLSVNTGSRQPGGHPSPRPETQVTSPPPATLVEAVGAATSAVLLAAVDHLAASRVGTLSPLAVSREDAARLIGLPVAAVEQLIRERRLGYVQVGAQRGRVIPVDALRRFIEVNLLPTGEAGMRKWGRH